MNKLRVSIIIAFNTIILMSISLYLFNTFQESNAKSGYHKNFIFKYNNEKHVVYKDYDKELGFGPAANSSQTQIDKFGEKVLFNKTYTFNQFSQRNVKSNNNNNRKNHFIIAGGSNSMGEGSNDDETLASQMSKLYSSHMFYNLNYAGFGPNQILRFIEKFDFKKMVKEDKGVLLYNLFDFHIGRAIGSIQYFTWVSPFVPRYLYENDEIKYDGNFVKQPKYMFWYLLRKLNIIQYYPNNYDYSDDEYLEFTALVLQRIKQLYLSQFPQGRFIVSITPFYGGIPYEAKIIKYLEKYKLDYLAFEKKYKDENSEFHYDYNRHITPKGHKEFAKDIKKKLIL